jgi:hypothetical protein
MTAAGAEAAHARDTNAAEVARLASKEPPDRLAAVRDTFLNVAAPAVARYATKQAKHRAGHQAGGADERGERAGNR